ncbi:MAG TPA: TIM44-like domain-containing protein [Acidimicrobiales bacterium]|nr:TIM44-like domain-containing protein [Acidimicrobiales bacterium]
MTVLISLLHLLLARAGGGDVFGGGSSGGSGDGGGFGGSGGGPFIFFGGGSSLGLVIFVLLMMFAFRAMSRRGRGRRPWGGAGGPWGGGPWGGGPWGGRGRMPPGWPGNGQGGTAPGGTSSSGNTGNSEYGGSGAGSQGAGTPGANSQGASSPGAGTPAGGGPGWTAGGGPATTGWPAGGGPAGGGWASGTAASDEGVPAGSGRGAGERLGATGGGWPGDESPDWMHDTRPAADSIPGELFPERHARAVQAASPVDAGLAAIKAHDPGFDLEQFTQQVQRAFFIVQEAWSDRNPEMSRQVMADGLWQEHRGQIQGYVDGHKRNMLDYLSVSNIWPVAARSDDRYDTITVRIVAACADYDVDDRSGRVVRGDRAVKPWEEDWTFQRSSRAVTKSGGTTLGSKCPNCGAPLDVDLAGTCRYCKAPIMSGEYDWVLARISQVG